jgi:hypothetical protein
MRRIQELPHWEQARHFTRAWPVSAGLVLSLLFAALWIVRSNVLYPEPAFTGEDFPVFWWQGEAMGVVSVIDPYAGYFHLIPRIAGVAATAFRPESGPVIFLAVYLAALVIVAWASVCSNAKLAGALMAAILVAPNAAEVAASITYFQWISCLFLLVLYASAPPKSLPSRILWAAGFLVSGLSGPFSALLLPVAASELLIRQSGLKTRFYSSANRLLPISFALLLGGLSVTAYLVVGSEQGRAGGGSLSDYSTLVQGAIRQVFSMLALGTLDASWGHIAVLIAALLGSVVAPTRSLAIKALLAFFSIAVAALAVHKFSDSPNAFSEPFFGSRYFFIGIVCALTIAILAILEGGLGRVSALLFVALSVGAWQPDRWRLPNPRVSDDHRLTGKMLEQPWGLVLVNPFWEFVVADDATGRKRLLWMHRREQLAPSGAVSVLDLSSQGTISITGESGNTETCGISIPVVSTGRQVERATARIVIEVISEGPTRSSTGRNVFVVDTTRLSDWSTINVGTGAIGAQRYTVRLSAFSDTGLHIGLPSYTDATGWEGHALGSARSFSALVWPMHCRVDSPFGRLDQYTITRR